MDSLFEKELRLEQLWPLMEEYLKAGKTVKFSPKGVSMLPMLRQGVDNVILSPVPEKLQKYDLPLYRYPSGKFVLHRIVAVEDDHYLCLGDNTYRYETVLPEYCVGLVTAFTRADREISVQAPCYRFYCRLWVALYPLRKFSKRAIGWLKRHVCK